MNDKRAGSPESRTLQKEKTPKEDLKVVSESVNPKWNKYIHTCVHACTHAGGTRWQPGQKLNGGHWMMPFKVMTRS